MFGVDLITFLKSLRKDTSDNNNGSEDSSSLGTKGRNYYSNMNSDCVYKDKLKICEKESIKVLINMKEQSEIVGFKLTIPLLSSDMVSLESLIMLK